MSEVTPRPPVLGFAAWSGTGKTTLLTGLLPRLRDRGLHVGMVKHAHHGFDVDTPGKDSYELRKAGAEQVLVASRQRWALMVERPREEEPQLDELLTRFNRDTLDIILVEGFKHLSFPKIELHRGALHKPLLFPGDESIIALATDTAVPTTLPTLNLNDLTAIADFVIEFARRSATAHRKQGENHD